MTNEILKKIKIKEKQLHKLLTKLLESNHMVWGSFCLIHVKCGNKYCQCKDGKLHPHRRMSWREDGRGLSRAVPKEEYDWIEEMTENYREFKKFRRELRNLEEELEGLLDTYEEIVVKKTRQGKAYLEISK